MTQPDWWAHFTPYEWGELSAFAPEDNWHELARIELLRRAFGGAKPCRTLYARGVDDDDLSSRLRELGGRLVLRAERTWGSVDEVYAWPEACARLYKRRGEVRVDLATSDEQLFERVMALARKLRPAESESNSVSVLVAAGGRLQLHSFEHAGEPFEPQNYCDEAVGAYNQALADLGTTTPAGRLCIIEGPTGTGKTFMLRALVHALSQAAFVLLPPATMKHLADPQLLTLLVESREEQRGGAMRPFVLLLEDADEAMVQRMADNMGAIAALLNMTDGMLGRLLDVRIVATTNSKHVELDPALLRAGRLSARIHTRSLDTDQCAAIYRRLMRAGGKPNDYRPTAGGWGVGTSLASVYAHAYQDGWRPSEPPAVDCGFARRRSPRMTRMKRTARLVRS